MRRDYTCQIGVNRQPVIICSFFDKLKRAALQYCRDFHVFAMVLGSPTYAVGVVLASLLVFSGLGSLQGKRLSGSSPRVLAAAFALLVATLAAFAVSKDLLASWLISWPLWLRIAGSTLTIAPLAFLMGLPMSTGMSLVGHRPDIMLWGWALNGVLSVFSSVAAIYLAIHHGIAMTFVAGTVCYLLAGLLIRIFHRRRVAAASPAAEELPAAG